jgi:hypothetical protein
MATDATARQIAELQANATMQAAGLQAGAQQASSELGKEASIYVADRNKETAIKTTQMDVQCRIDVANIDAASRLAAVQAGNTGNTQQAEIGAAAQRYSADASREAAITTARIDADNRLATTTLTTDVTREGNQLDYQGRVQVANISAGAQTAAAQIDADNRLAVAQINSEAEHYSADRQYASTQLRETGENARLQTKLNYAEDKFQLAFGLASDVANGSDQASGTPGLLAIDSAPYVTTRGVLTPSQIQAQVNGLYVRNDVRMASLIRQAQGDLAGRGFSSNSPLLDALRVSYAAQNLRASTEGSTGLRIQAAQANASQVTQGQSLAVQRWQAQQQVALDSEKNAITRKVGLLGAVAQMVGSVG